MMEMMELIDHYPHLSPTTLAALAIQGADQGKLDRLEAEAVKRDNKIYVFGQRDQIAA